MSANSRKFWRCWKGCFKSPSDKCDMNVNGLKDDASIASHLAKHFQDTCTPENINTQNKFIQNYLLKKSDYPNSTKNFSIDVEDVDRAVKHLDFNKASGFDNITVEHISYAHPAIVIILSVLFNIMLKTGLVPDDFGIGVTTPIPKFKGNKKQTTADDFRGITICPIISKIFELCIVDSFSGIDTSVRQFGFKKSVGCNNSLHTVRKVINYYNIRKSTVNLATIDVRKAFDKVDTFGILCMLQDKQVDIGIINVLENWFSKSKTKMKWNKVISEQVPLLSGVKQGGILSPLLFTLYVDILLEKLEQSGLGCYIGMNCYNSFMYADDIILLSISVTDLQLMFKLCVDIFNDLNLSINISKCNCLRIGPRCNMTCKVLTIHGNIVQWVEQITFLGMTICRAKAFKCNWDSVKAKFYRSSNAIIGKLGTSAPANVILKLINAQGVQILLYGISATTLNESEIKSFSHAYNSVFAKIFNSYDNNVLSFCQFYSGYLNFNVLYDLHRYTFLTKLIKGGYLHEKSTIDRFDFCDYRQLQNKYHLCESDSSDKVKYNMWKHFETHIGI